VFLRRSAAADELHEFKPVTLGEHRQGMFGLWHDLEIALDRDAPRVASRLA